MKNFITYCFLATVLMLTSCKVDEPPVNNRSVDDILLDENYKVLSFMQILENYTTEKGVYNPVRTRSDGEYASNLFSIDTIAYDMNNDGIYNDKDAVYFMGRVISDDFTGNIYKNLILQDVLDPKHGVTFVLDASSLSGYYPLGQVLLVRLNGLAIGKYANQYEIGCASYYNRTNETAMNATSKVGWCIGRIPFNRFNRWTQRIGVADPSKIVVTDMTIPQMRQEEQENLQGLCGRLVRIKNVHFTSEYYDTNGKPQPCDDKDPRVSQNAAVFAPTTDFINFSQGRIFKDEDGNDLSVSTSEFAKFAYYKLPDEQYVGDVVGIVGYYYDQAKYKANNSKLTITLRGIGIDGSINDLQNFRNDDGNLWIPMEWAVSALAN